MIAGCTGRISFHLFCIPRRHLQLLIYLARTLKKLEFYDCQIDLKNLKLIKSDDYKLQELRMTHKYQEHQPNEISNTKGLIQQVYESGVGKSLKIWTFDVIELTKSRAQKWLKQYPLKDINIIGNNQDPKIAWTIYIDK